MLQHLKYEASRYGLNMYVGKTKILTNNMEGYKKGVVKLGTEKVEVISPFEAEKYLGKKYA